MHWVLDACGHHGVVGEPKGGWRRWLGVRGRVGVWMGGWMGVQGRVGGWVEGWVVYGWRLGRLCGLGSEVNQQSVLRPCCILCSPAFWAYPCTCITVSSSATYAATRHVTFRVRALPQDTFNCKPIGSWTTFAVSDVMEDSGAGRMLGNGEGDNGGAVDSRAQDLLGSFPGGTAGGPPQAAPSPGAGAAAGAGAGASVAAAAGGQRAGTGSGMGVGYGRGAESAASVRATSEAEVSNKRDTHTPFVVRWR